MLLECSFTSQTSEALGRLRGNAPSSQNIPMSITHVRILVWSDCVCPFCYLELPVLDRIQREFGDEVQVDWRAFELRPDPAPTLDPNGDYLRRIWGQSVYPMAEERGLSLRLQPVQPRSRKAFEAVAFAREVGQFDAMHRALFRAFFEEGRDLADLAVLVDIGQSVGLKSDDLQTAQATGRYAAGVLEDQRQASDLRISGVPALVITNGRAAYSLNGAQPFESVRRAVRRVLEGR
jgi:predicted DsbA family dithiol-disulfide isomerase